MINHDGKDMIKLVDINWWVKEIKGVKYFCVVVKQHSDFNTLLFITQPQ